MRRRTCPFCSVEQQISDQQLAKHPFIRIQCHQCGESSAYSISNRSPVELDLKKLFVAEKKEKKIPMTAPAQLAASKRRFALSVFTVLISLNIFFAIKINSKMTQSEPEIQKFHLTAAAPLPLAPQKEVEIKILNQFVASILVPRAIVRGGPGAEKPAIYSLNLNDKVTVVGWNKNWMNIESMSGNEKITGWIRADLIGGMAQ
jgi:hypothetical protein